MKTLKELRCAFFVIVLSILVVAPETLPAEEGTGPGGAAEYTGEAEARPEAGGTLSDAAAHKADVCAQVIMKTASEAKEKPYLVTTDDFIIIGNHYIGAGFDKKTFEIIALVDVAADGTLLAVGTGPLWKITLADDKRQTIEVNSKAEAQISFAINKGEESAALHLRWSKISTPEEEEIISAQVRIVADAGSRYLVWKMDVDCDSEKRGLWEVDFPRIESIVPMGDTEETALLMPWGTGWVVKNPFAEDKAYEGQYPAPSAPMQFSAVYGGKSGLYLAAHDGDMYIKRFFHETKKDSETLTYYLRNLPENRGDVGISYRMPYEFVMTTFSGDWYTACRIYREWATKQVWCSKGPIQARADIPAWYKKLGYWMIAWEQKALGAGQTYEEKIKPKIGEGDQTLEDIRVISKKVAVPTAVHLYGWHASQILHGYPTYFPPLIGDEAFKKQMDALHEMGCKVVPYVIGTHWDNWHADYAKLNVEKYCIKTTHGSPYRYRMDQTRYFKKGLIDKPIRYSDYICPYTKFWQDKMVEVSEKVVGDYKMDGVYYDVLSGNCHECFDPDHGHTKGGGNYWAEGNRKLLKRCSEAIKEINPDAMTTSEQPTEVYIDCLDSMLLYTVQYKPGTVPALQAVYHDYMILFGNANLTAKGSLESFPMSLGESFTAGDQLGWFNHWPMFTPGHPRDELSIYWEDLDLCKKYTDFTAHKAQLRYNAGQKFLVCGEMLKPLTFENELPYREGYWVREGLGLRRLPAVMHSVWRASDGSLGLVFCNITDDEHGVEFKLNLEEYSIPKAKRYLLIEHNIDGSEEVIEKYETRSFKRKVTMPPLSGYILEVRPE